jgi:hypothetical protein
MDVEPCVCKMKLSRALPKHHTSKTYEPVDDGPTRCYS